MPHPLSLPNPSAASQPATPAIPATPHGFRAQISHLIPRHSYFRARVAIHQIDSVPFVSGQFAVRWKFKHVHAPPSNPRPGGLLGIVKTRSKNGDKRAPADDATETVSSSSSSDPSLPSLVLSTDSSRSTAISNASLTTLHIHPPLHATSSPLLSYSTTTPTSTPTPTPTPTPTADTTTPARGATLYNPLKDHSVHWNQHLSTVVRLDVDRDNGYIFPCPFKLVVMQRPSDGDYIYSSGHTNVPEVHRLGAVYLNLSEYVGHGPVERRYLLRESRTNTTLKLTIELDFISGQTSYIPPPLPKGEILNGLSGYLETEFSRSGLPAKSTSPSNSAKSSSDPRRRDPNHYHPPPNNIELYGPYLNQEELELDLFGTRCSKRKRSKSSFVMVFNRSRSKLGLTTDADDDNEGRKRREDDSEEGESDYEFMDDQFTHHSPNTPTTITIVPPSAPLPPSQPPSPDTTTTPTPTFPTRKPTFFDVERLPMAYGTKTTETLIEAIFNPVRIDEERCESPFTVYVPPSAPASLGVDGEEEMYTPRPPPPPPPPPHAHASRSSRSSQPHRIKRKAVPSIEVASVYSNCSTTTTSSTSNSSSSMKSTETSCSGKSGMMAKSVRSQVSRVSGGSRVSAQSSAGVGVGGSAGVGSVGVGTSGAGVGGTGGGKVRDWWKKTVSGHGGG